MEGEILAQQDNMQDHLSQWEIDTIERPGHITDLPHIEPKKQATLLRDIAESRHKRMSTSDTNPMPAVNIANYGENNGVFRHIFAAQEVLSIHLQHSRTLTDGWQRELASHPHAWDPRNEGRYYNELLDFMKWQRLPVKASSRQSVPTAVTVRSSSWSRTRGLTAADRQPPLAPPRDRHPARYDNNYGRLIHPEAKSLLQERASQSNAAGKADRDSKRKSEMRAVDEREPQRQKVADEREHKRQKVAEEVDTMLVAPARSNVMGAADAVKTDTVNVTVKETQMPATPGDAQAMRRGLEKFRQECITMRQNNNGELLTWWDQRAALNEHYIDAHLALGKIPPWELVEATIVSTKAPPTTFKCPSASAQDDAGLAELERALRRP